jgi:hypothetical protein
MGPRTADDDGIVQNGLTQREGTGIKASGSVTEASVRLRAQPAILYYRARRKTVDVEEDSAGGSGLLVAGNRQAFPTGKTHFE